MRRQGGYVALISVLILGAIAIAVASALLLTGTDTQREVLAYQRSAQARNLAYACIEEGLQQLHDSSSFTGTNTVTLATGGCTYTVTNAGGSTRIVDATSTISGVVRKARAYVTINASSISITSWQDVS